MLLEQPAVVVAQGLRSLLVPMRGLTIADGGRNGRAVYCAIGDPWCDQRMLSQARDQGLGVPSAKGRTHRAALTASSPTA